MRTLIACVFFYSLDGLLADEGTEYWRFCFGLPDDPAEQEQSLHRFRSADCTWSAGLHYRRHR